MHILLLCGILNCQVQSHIIRVCGAFNFDTNLLKHFLPFPTNPSLHSQLYDPGVSVHVANGEHLSIPNSHSSMFSQTLLTFLKPALHTQVYVPIRFMHVDTSRSHLWVPSHSLMSTHFLRVGSFSGTRKMLAE